MRKWAYSVIICKYCSNYTIVPNMLDQNSLYCRYCTSKHCFTCVVRMHHDIYTKLVEIHKDNPKYDLSSNFDTLDFATRMLTLECGDCLVAMVKCASKDPQWGADINPVEVI